MSCSRLKLCRAFGGLVLVLLFLAYSTSPGQAEAPILNPLIPSQPFLETQLKKTHPRLLVTPDDFARVKKLIRENDLARRWYDKLRQEALKILGDLPSRYQTKGREGVILEDQPDRVAAGLPPGVPPAAGGRQPLCPAPLAGIGRGRPVSRLAPRSLSGYRRDDACLCHCLRLALRHLVAGAAGRPGPGHPG